MKSYLTQGNLRNQPCLFVLCFLFLIFLNLPMASAADINVTTTTDELNADGDCSLREAITAANTDTAVDACPAGLGEDTINIPAGTYTLSIAGTDEDSAATGDLDITAGVTLNGQDADTTIIDAAGIDRVIDFIPFRSHFGVTIKNLTIMGGGDVEHGGGIYVVDAWFNSMNNTLTLVSSKVTNNTASRQGGGIYSRFVTLHIKKSTISENTAGLKGGGISYKAGLEFKMIASTVSGNSVNSVDKDITSDFADGGGIYLSDQSWFNVIIPSNNTIIDSTISGNSVSGSPNNRGGGIFLNGFNPQLELYNVTIAKNEANSGDLVQGGGIYIESGDVDIKNTLIADNTTNGAAGDCYGTIASASYSLIEDTKHCTITTSGFFKTGDPLLGLLADNGGPTQTHALLAGSPAIDAGDSGNCLDDVGEKIINDQRRRGYKRHKDGDGNGSKICDIGAFEL